MLIKAQIRKSQTNRQTDWQTDGQRDKTHNEAYHNNIIRYDSFKKCKNLGKIDIAKLEVRFSAMQQPSLDQ